MTKNIYVRIDDRVHLLDYADWDEENKCLLWYVFDSKEPFNEKEHKIEVIDDESNTNEH